tara:strand:+ start:51 stop:521 length:471 start_codon:yes stop_codon:yes gene_type:complete
MCDPVTAMIAMTTASTAMTIHGQRQAAKSQQAMHEYNAQVQENNAIIAKQNAEFENEKHKDNLRRILGSQKASFSASGITRTGSTLDVQLDTVTQGELDSLTILYGGNLKASGAEQSAVSQRMAGAAVIKESQSKIGQTILAGGNQALMIKESYGS